MVFLLPVLAPAEPATLRLSGRVTASNKEKNPAVAQITGKLFSLKARVFVVDSRTARIRLEILNRSGPQAFYSVHAALLDSRGYLLGGGGGNDVNHQKKRGEVMSHQWDILVTDLQSLSNFQMVLYEDSVFVGRR